MEGKRSRYKCKIKPTDYQQLNKLSTLHGVWVFEIPTQMLYICKNVIQRWKAHTDIYAKIELAGA